jgi:hypothetical protein
MRKELSKALEDAVKSLDLHLAEEVWMYFSQLSDAAGRYLYLRDAADSAVLDRLAYWEQDEWDDRIDKLIKQDMESDDEYYYDQRN